MPAVRTLGRVALAVSALVVLLVVGLRVAMPAGGARSPAAGMPVAAPARADARCRPARARDVTVVVPTHDGRRTAVVHVPGGLRRPPPLILAFHGSGGNGPFMQSYSGLSRVASPRGIAVAYPTAVQTRRRWTLEDDGAQAPDDVGFVRRLLVRLERWGCADPQRVYATGVSNGGGFAALLACRLGSRIAAIAPVAGRYGAGPCAPDRPISVLEIHGVADPVSPYRGRPPAFEGAVRPWVQAWAQRDGCTGLPVRTAIATRTVRFDWQHCAQPGVQVSHIAVLKGEHAWPGSTPPADGPPSTISAARVVVTFFAGRRLARPR